AESERQTQGVLRGAIRVVALNLRSATLVELIAIERTRQEPAFERNQRDPGFDDSGRTQRMPGPSFRGARERRRRKQVPNDGCFHLVVLARRGAMQIDVVDFVGRELGARERLLERKARAETFGMRCRHVMRIARLAAGEQPWTALRAAFEQRKARRFADIDSAALSIEGT